MKNYFKALKLGVISLINISNFRENEEIMQLTQIDSKKYFDTFGSIKNQSMSEFGTLGAV